MTIGKPDRNKPERERKDSMKLYNVYVYNTRDNYHDCYMVNAVDSGDGLNVWEILGVKGVQQ